MRESFATKMAMKGKYEFTTEQMASELGIRRQAADDRIRTMRRNREIITPTQGFHVVLPFECRTLRNMPPINYIDPLMKHFGQSYYIGLLSAADMYGASHQKPMVLQIMINRPRSSIRCADARIDFIVCNRMKRPRTVRKSTGWGRVTVASPELTAFEMMGYADQCGGMSNVATILIDLHGSLDIMALRTLAEVMPVSWTQRLGYLFELIQEYDFARTLIPTVKRKANTWVSLNSSFPAKGCERSNRWKLVLNETVEPENM